MIKARAICAELLPCLLSAPCGTVSETIFTFPRHAERCPDDFHASAKCGALTKTIFAIPYRKESRPERFSAFLIIRIFAPGFVVPLPQFFGNRDRHGIQHVGGCNDGHHDAHGSRTCRTSHGYARSVRYGSGRNSANSMTAASTNATTVPAVNWCAAPNSMPRRYTISVTL